MTDFIELTNFVGLTALDIGARGGPNSDLIEFASAVDMYCFEPDPDENQKLSQKDHKPWKSVTYIPSAVAAKEEPFTLHLCKKRGCSSKFVADHHTAALFNRDDYYIDDGSITVPAKPLDNLISEYSIKEPAFLKIDVQGMEVECFSGAHTLLTNSLVGIRTEISFFSIYEGAPLFSDIDKLLSPFGFIPMRFLEMHEWRRNTKDKWPKISKGELPYSRGQIIHGDVLYLLHPEKLPSTSEQEIKKLIRLALISICYEHLDHAYAIFSRENIRIYVKEKIGFDPLISLIKISRQKSKRNSVFKKMGVIMCNEIVKKIH